MASIMDDKDIFVTLEANLIEAVKRLVQNARNELDTRRKGRSQQASGKPANTANVSAKHPAAKPAENKSPATKPAEAPAKPADVPAVKPADAAAAKPADAPKPAESPKELGNMMDVFASILPVADETPTETPTPEATEPLVVTAEASPDPDEAKRQQFDELALEVDADLHGMKHMTAERPKQARRKTQATAPKFDPSATILPDPVPIVVALVPEPTEQERKAAAGPRQPLVQLGDLQKRGAARAGGPGRGGGAAGGRRETLGEKSPAHKVEPKPPQTPEPKEPASPPPEIPKLPEEGAATPDAEAPPLPSLPVTTPSPLRTPSTDNLEPDPLLSLEPRRNSGAAPPLPALPAEPGQPAVKRPGPPPPGPPSRAMSPAPPRKSSNATPPTQLHPPDQEEIPPPVPVTPVAAEGDAGATPAEAAPPPEPEKKLSAVMSAARAKQPAINLADIMKPRTPKADVPKPAAAPAAAGPAIPNCAECGCSKFVMNPFKKGTNCSTCFHPHPAPG